MNFRLLPVLAFTLIIVACGGGSSAGVTVPPPGSAPLVIDSNNAKPAARTAYSASANSMRSGEQVGGPGVSIAPGNNFAKPYVKQSLANELLRGMQNDASKSLPPCAVSGTETTTANLANPLTLTAGDTIIVDYVSCDNGFGEILDGRIQMTIAVFSGDLLSGLYLLDVNVVLVNFQVQTAEDTILANGDSTVSIDTLGLPMVLLSVGGNSLSSTSNASTETITNFQTSQSVDTSVFPEPYTQTTSGTVDSSQLAGTISYTTPVTFQGVGDTYPFAGELLITGAGNATIRVIALDAVNIRIETDIDGDGVVDSSEDTTWDDIAP